MAESSTTIAVGPPRREELVKHLGSNKVLTYNSLFLGLFMFSFGFLKFFEPFRTWFDVQITNSGLPHISISLGKAGEMAIGLGLLSALFFKQRIPKLYVLLVFAASAGLVVNMGIATYVHLQPKVPASVLPLGIKPPIIPLSVMVLAALNLYQLYLANQRRPLW